jgi:hypothetical protein
MNLIDTLIKNNLSEAKKIVEEKLSNKIVLAIEEKKKVLFKDFLEEDGLLEAIKRNPNIIKMGRINRIRRRIRRNAKGKIVVQKNRRRSGLKGYKISGNRVVRIPATVRLRKARLLKRSWKTTRRAKLRRSLLKRKLSMRRRASLGLR